MNSRIAFNLTMLVVAIASIAWATTSNHPQCVPGFVLAVYGFGLGTVSAVKAKRDAEFVAWARARVAR